FYINKLLDRDTKDPTFYINIKLKELRDILREVLKDIYSISLIEEKLIVERYLLYYYLPELELY
ncbi:hypothetical protein L207DRAFT_445881, partial [Hyaloscypha variabilis F]